MDKEQPTQEQIKEFWEWCGFKQVENWKQKGFHYENTIKKPNWVAPDEPLIEYGISYLPRIDLNNLFKYAVPKLPAGSLLWYGNNKGYGVCINYPHIEIDNQNPALALFWVIWEVIHG
jgi:hypothetical protein